MTNIYLEKSVMNGRKRFFIRPFDNLSDITTNSSKFTPSLGHKI